VFEVAPTPPRPTSRLPVEQSVQVKVEAGERGQREGQEQAFGVPHRRRGDWRKAYVKLADGQTIDRRAAVRPEDR
jgi:large subunit ribosomal protein L23